MVTNTQAMERAEDHIEEAGTGGDTPGEPARELSIGEAARVLGVSVRTVRRWDADGVLTVARTAGGHRRFRLEDILELRARRDRRTANTRTEHRRPPLPSGPAPALAAILSDHARRELLRRTVTHLYPEDQRGWFASIPAIQANHAFLGALRRSASTGDWTESVSAASLVQIKAGSAGEDVTYQEYFRFMRTLRAVLVGAMGERAPSAAKTVGTLFERLEYDAAGNAAQFAVSPDGEIGTDPVDTTAPGAHERFDPGDIDAVSRSCDRLGRYRWVMAVTLLAGDANAAQLDLIATTAGAPSGEPLVLVDDELAGVAESGEPTLLTGNAPLARLPIRPALGPGLPIAAPALGVRGLLALLIVLAEPGVEVDSRLLPVFAELATHQARVLTGGGLGAAIKLSATVDRLGDVIARGAAAPIDN